MEEAGAPNPIVATFGRAEPQRRWTVLLRLLLVIPQVVVLSFVSVAVLFVVVYGWFAALVLGRFPEPAARFVVQFLRWQLRVTAYLYLMTDRYPPFHGYDDPSYPVRMAAAPGPLNRLAVLFRVVLAFPVWVLSSLLAGGLGGFSIVTWVLTLVMGRIPEPIFEASAVVLRFVARVDGYFSLVTSEWPWGSFGDRAAPGEVPGFAAPPPTFLSWGQYPYATPGPYPASGAAPVPGPYWPPPGPYGPAPGPGPVYPPPYGPPAGPGPIYPPPYGPPPGTGYVPPPGPPYGAPSPYGTPPPYAAVPPAGPPPTAALPPPVVRPQEPAVSREAAGWRLVPMSSAKALLVVFLIIGAYLQFTDVSAISATRATPSPPASSQTATAPSAGLSPGP